MSPTPRTGQLPPEWLASGLVILAGAGASMAPPASVPSWWGFNDAVLAGLRRHLLLTSAVPVRSRGPLERLSLDALDVRDFSQVVHNAFAGVTWFRLLSVLEGSAPNTTHRTIASLAQNGIVRAVVTTNFDTLFERSLPASFSRFNAFLDEVPRAAGGVLLKLHGTAGRADSLIDLATQKRCGIRSQWWMWLRRSFANHCVLVLGFSGADLELGEDYLGLRAASESTPWLGWNVRPGSTPHPRAREILRVCAERGRLVSGDLPGVMADLGIALVAGGRAHGDAAERVTAAVDEWLAEPQVDGDVCGVALARLLEDAGSRSAADALRSALRTRTRRQLGDGLDLERAVRASLVLGQLGTDDENDARAMKDLDLAERALEAVMVHLRRRDGGMPPRGDVEYARNMSNLAHGKAVRYLRQGDAATAQVHIDRAWTHINALPPVERADRLSAHWQNQGAVAWLNGDRNAARELFERSRAVATATGDVQFMTRTDETLRRMAADADGPSGGPV